MAALFIAPDALQFPIVAGVVAILLIALIVVATGLIRRTQRGDGR
jgi:hypothetical protein